MELLIWCLVNDDTASSGLSSRVERHLHRSDSQNWGPYMLSKLRIRQFSRWYSSLSLKDRLAIFVLDPGEAINTGWLVYIVIAQTFGLYQNYDCMASIWGGRGVRASIVLISEPGSLTRSFQGFIDFESYATYLANGVGVYWGSGIATSLLVMCIAFVFIVAEYCTQSHLSTVDYEKSKRGLRWTRWFKKHTYLFRSIPHLCIGYGMHLWLNIMGKKEFHERRSLMWTWKTREPEGSPALENQDSNLTLPSRGSNRENYDALESDDGEQPGDILMGPLGIGRRRMI